MASIPQWLINVLLIIVLIIVIAAVVSFVGGSCDFSIGDFSAGGGAK